MDIKTLLQDFHEKECHVLCVLTYTRTQNISNVRTVSASSAWSSGTEQAMAETQADVRNAKLSTKCRKVPIWKIYQPVFTCTTWLMCWPLTNFKTVKYCEEIATRKAPRRLIVSSVAYFTAKNAPLDTTSCEVTKTTVFWHLIKDFQEKDFEDVIIRPIHCSAARKRRAEILLQQL